MDTINEALGLLRRQEELETAMRRPGGIRILEERELRQLRLKIEQLPEAIKTAIQTAQALNRPVTQITEQDVDHWVNAGISRLAELPQSALGTAMAP